MMTNIPEKAIYAPSTSIIQVKNLCLMQVYGFMHNSLLPEPWAGKSYAYSRVMLVYSMLMERFYCTIHAENMNKIRDNRPKPSPDQRPVVIVYLKTTQFLKV